MVRALNSMKIIHKGQYYANRGASGIDGNISTAIGLLSQINKPSIALLGDLSFLHDIGALALLTKLELPPVLFIVTNNGGGGIFQKLPIATNQKHFEEFFFTPHKQNLVDIAKSFGLKVKEINQLNEFKTSINSWLEESTHTMIQINL